MRIIIFTAFKPVLSQTWFLNELDILKKANIEFLVFYDTPTKSQRQLEYHKYLKHFVYIPKCPKNIIKILRYIFFYNLPTFLIHPIKYTKVLLFILTSYRWVYLRDFFKLVKVIPIIEQFNPDLIYSHYIYDHYIFAFLNSLFFNKKCGLIFHSNYPYPQHISSILNKSLFILAKSDSVRNDFLKKYPDLTPAKIKVLPWGVDTTFFYQQVKKKESNIFTITSISRFVEMKGLSYLLRACRLLANKNIRFKCLIVGYGKEKWKLQKYIQKADLERYVGILSGISHSRKFKQMLSFTDLFVLPAIVNSAGESDFMPNAILEAMAMEVPILTTRVTGMHEVITNGVNGFLVKEKDEIDLANMIENVIGLPRERRVEIGRKAREIVVKYFDKEKQGEKFIEFLKDQIYHHEKEK